MRTITITKNLYTFNELSEKAKERVKQDYLSDEFRTEIFLENCMYKINELFPNSNLEIQFSLCGCQGDGFNIYGEIFLTDLLENLKDKFSSEELKTLEQSFMESGIDFYRMVMNHYYYYCMAAYHVFTEGVERELGYHLPVFDKFDKAARLYIKKLCEDFENTGYDFFYHVSDEEIEDWANVNEYEFTENGIISF